MLPRLKEAKYKGDYKIWLKFEDGAKGVVDLEEELWGDIFLPLKDKNKFAEFVFNKELGTIVWPNGADFAPEFLYKMLRPSYVLKAPSKSGAA
ncbi:MAG TPA: DUF2442 domain-containing protein [Caldithrix abyssi]|uniref:DUF2442 domain-containing protein n=1 Tax=Caldithrix abyssi TaxID=187145 RepID=A0A7V4TYX1_CALAY|nr:DUF2442 domain-containing protein [Caldithrix abyssi]